MNGEPDLRRLQVVVGNLVHDILTERLGQCPPLGGCAEIADEAVWRVRKVLDERESWK